MANEISRAVLSDDIKDDIEGRLQKSQNLVDLPDKAAARTALALVPGVTIQPYSDKLDAVVAMNAADRVVVTTSGGNQTMLGASPSANLIEVSAVDPGTTGKVLLAAATVNVAKEALQTFKTVSDLLVSSAAGAGVGTRWKAGPYEYEELASNDATYDTLRASGTRLRVPASPAGVVDAMAFGAVGTGASTPISTRYGNLAAAQAAFPRAHALGKVVALTDEIDGIAIQEAIIVAQERLYKPAMRIGQGGRFLTTRKIEAGVSGQGIEILGTDFRTAQQGSVRTGVTLVYAGSTEEPLLEVTGTFTKLRNLAFESLAYEGVPKATYALFISGDGMVSGGGRNHLEGISIQQAGGTVAWTQGSIKVFNGIDYTFWRDLEIACFSPKLLDYDGGALGEGGTTRFNISDSVFTSHGTTARTGFKYKNANIEQVTFQNCSFNNYLTDAPIEWFNTMEINAANALLDIDSFRLIDCEFDSYAMHADSRLGRFKRVHMLDIDGGHWQTASGTIPCVAEITETTATASPAFYITGGEVFRCMDSESRILPERKGRMQSGARGLAGTSLQGNVRVATLSTSTILNSFDVDNRHQGFRADVSADGAHQVNVRSHTDSPPGHWLQGQTMSFRVHNTGTVPYTGLTWGASIRAKNWLPLAPGYARTVFFQWDGAYMWESSRSQDVKVSGSDPISAGLLPGGRMSLVPNVAFSEAEVNGGSVLYYLGHRGLHVPVLRGADFESVRIPDSLFMNLDGNAGHELYHAADAIHDVWYGISADGATRIGTGPTWAAGATAGSVALPYAFRGMGAGSTERELYGGVPVNKNSMRWRYLDGSGDIETKAARTLTYLGSIAICTGFAGTTSDSQTERLVANAWNREPRLMRLREPGAGVNGTWTYNSGTMRQVNANTANVLKVLINDSAMWVKIHAVLAAIGGDATMRLIQTAIGEGGVTKLADQLMGWTNVNNVSGTIEQATATWEGNPLLGIHKYWWLEAANTGNAVFYGMGANPPELSGMNIRVEN